MVNKIHPLEADESFAKTIQQQHQRNLKSHDKPPPVHDDTQHGMMIDAGSQGTRIHIYEFDTRELKHRHDVKLAAKGLKLSIPNTDTRWTDRLKPGIDSFAFLDDNEMKVEVSQYLKPLIDFAKMVLEEKQGDWKAYPIYLKATGGMRTLPRPYRIKLIGVIRHLFHNKTFNPFYFEDEHARVISGEEEAIYGWTAVNFVMGTLISNSEGSGTVLLPNVTYGMLEMGGASVQIGFFEPEGDVMANLFKLQIGAAKHWNVYAHSFLYFGVMRAYDRLNARLFLEVDNDDITDKKKIHSPCLPGHSEHTFTSRVHLQKNNTLMPLSSPYDPAVLEAEEFTAILHNKNDIGDFDQCYARVKLLLRKEANAWCDFAHDRDCSFAGIYQPPLPNLQFIATSNFYSVWDFLQLPSKSPLRQVMDGARKICTMSFGELRAYNDLRNKPLDESDLHEQCFRATFVVAFLGDGVGFKPESEIMAIDVANGQKLGWALGSMLYEINTLPWEFSSKKVLKKSMLLNIFDSNEGPFFTEDGTFNGILVATLMAFVIFGLWTKMRPRTRNNVGTVEQSTAIIANNNNNIRSNYGTQE